MYIPSAYSIAKEIANSGDYTLLSDILDELRINWPSTYNLVVEELYENLGLNDEMEI